MRHYFSNFAIFMAASALIFTALSGPASAKDKPAPMDFGKPEALYIKSENGVHEFEVEIADTLTKQSRGLMYRESLDPSKGMLFEFSEPKLATIWMKNTPISLDIIFIRGNGHILKIEHSTQPYTLRNASSEASVAAVLELAGGTSKDIGIMPGDLVQHDFFNTQP